MPRPQAICLAVGQLAFWAVESKNLDCKAVEVRRNRDHVRERPK
jgi:hypothetical protein